MAMLGGLGLKGGIVGKADGKSRASASVMFRGTIRTVRSVAISVSSCTTGTITSSLSVLAYSLSVNRSVATEKQNSA